MLSNEDLEKRFENLEKEVQHLKAALQYQTKKEINWQLIEVELTASCII